MNYLILAIEIGVLLLIVLIGLYDWFYTNSVKKMKKQWGIIFPPLVKKLVIFNIRVTILSIGILIALILYTLYTYFSRSA